MSYFDVYNVIKNDNVSDMGGIEDDYNAKYWEWIAWPWRKYE